MYARTASDRNVELCEEDKTEPGSREQMPESHKKMYGTRAAAHDWQSEVTRTMAKHFLACSRTGKAILKRSFTGTNLSHPMKAELGWLCKGLLKKFETKMTMVGEDDDLAKEARVLNRIVR